MLDRVFWPESTRREFLKKVGGSAAVAALGGSWLSACGTESSTSPPTEVSGDFGFGGNADLPYTVMVNPTDPLLMRAETDDGRFEYFGDRTSNGIPERITHVVAQVNGGQATVEYDGGGLPTRISDEAGAQVQFQWAGPTTAVITAVNPSGTLQISTDIDFASVGSAPVPVAAAHAGLRPRAGRRIHLEQVETTKPVGPLASSNASTTEGDVFVSVHQCGEPAEGPHSVSVLVNGDDGNLLWSAPGKRVGTGRYRATIPTRFDASTIEQNAGSICSGLATALGVSCAAVDSLNEYFGGQSALVAVAVCDAVAVAADVATVPSGEAAVLIAACHKIVPAWILACLATGGAAPGAPGLADALCNAVAEDRAFEEDFVLSAQVAALPSPVRSDTRTVAASGPFGEFTVDLGSEVKIQSITFNPPNPGDGQDYVATAAIVCALAGSSVQVRVVGTDGYEDSIHRTVDSTQATGTFVLEVPGAVSGVRDTITVTVTLPLGARIERTASVVFGG